jgi:hypothetical protein
MAVSKFLHYSETQVHVSNYETRRTGGGKTARRNVVSQGTHVPHVGILHVATGLHANCAKMQKLAHCTKSMFLPVVE